MAANSPPRGKIDANRVPRNKSGARPIRKCTVQQEVDVSGAHKHQETTLDLTNFQTSIVQMVLETPSAQVTAASDCGDVVTIGKIGESKPDGERNQSLMRKVTYLSSDRSMKVEVWTVGKWLRTLLTATVLALLIIAIEAPLGWISKTLVFAAKIGAHLFQLN
jgi:hypothetical protein